jgi:two-component system sensor histidine kinase VicK
MTKELAWEKQMTVQTESGHTDALTCLLNEARTEADALRLKLLKYEKTLLSSRLVMGHELKRPATAIGGYLDLALEGIACGDTKAVEETVKKARRECRLLNELNSFFLELLKVNGRSGESEGQRVNARECIEGVAEHFSPELNAKERIDIHVAADAETVSFNSNAFKIVLSNVIENALIYSDGDKPVNVAVEKTPDKRALSESDLLKIRVTDQGFGIPDDCLRRIFEPFVRLNDRVGKGTGLGLTLVRSLVELHGGNVYVRSVEGQGTTVQITVPEIPVRNGGAFVS